MQHAAGGVVYRQGAAGDWLVLLIQDKYGIWTLPKGHIEQGETLQETAQREIVEETGVRSSIGDLVDQVHYQVFKKGRWRDKRVAFFLAAALTSELTPAADEGIADVRWVPATQAQALIGYALVQEIVGRAIAMLPQAGGPATPSS